MRARNIKPGFFKNDLLAEVPPLGRLLFAGLWCLADREGRLEDRPKRIKAELLPYDEVDTDRLLGELVDRGFIRRYRVGGNGFIAVCNFLKHQNPHVKEKASVIPPPEGASEKSTGDAPGENGACHGEALGRHHIRTEKAGLIPDSPSPKPDSRKHCEKTPQLALAPEQAKTPDPMDSDFQEFWGTLIRESKRSQSRADIKTRYTKARKGLLSIQKQNRMGPASHEEIMAGLRRANAFWGLRDVVDEFIPTPQMASTWLNKAGWTADYRLHDPPPAGVVEQAKTNEFLQAVIGGHGAN